MKRNRYLNIEIQANKELIKEKEEEFDKSGLREVAIQKGQDELDFVASNVTLFENRGNWNCNSSDVMCW